MKYNFPPSVSGMKFSYQTHTLLLLAATSDAEASVEGMMAKNHPPRYVF